MPELTPISESEVRELARRAVERILAQVPNDVLAPDPVTEGSASPAGAEAIAIGADHGGFKLKEELVVKLRAAGHEVTDCGTDSPAPADYPELAHTVARLVADGTCRWGIVIDGAGIGSAMVANKVPGVRAALCYDLSTARNSREHNHANVLTLGAGLIGANLAWQIVQEWLAVPWGPDRHARRVAMITEIEQRYARSAR